MGAWSHEPFGNDTAGDWSYELEESEGLQFLQETFEKVIAEGEEYLEGPEGEEAVAAADVLARLAGHERKQDAHTEEVDAWVAACTEKPGPDLLSLAVRALDRVLAPDSELAELWEEGEGGGEWRAGVEALRSLLAA